MFRQLTIATLALSVFLGVPLGEFGGIDTANAKRVSKSVSKSDGRASTGSTGSTGSTVKSKVLASAVNALAAKADPTDPMNAFEIPGQTRQIIVGVTNGWAGNKAQLRRFTRKSGVWTSLDAEPITAVLGPKGLAWGRGLNPVPGGAISSAGGVGSKRTKREGDKRSPAGVFSLGKAYGYDPIWSARTKLDYVTVTPADLFIEDTSSEFYNHQIRLDHPAASAWELSQQMEQTDPAHRLEVVVDHNTPRPIRGAGSAILLHIWRQNGKKFTTGCTAMADTDMESIVRWLDPGAHPLYVLLPRSEYLTRQASWGLPPLPSSDGPGSAAVGSGE